MRIGHGFDIHRLAIGLPLKIGGVTIPWTHGLVGHSDADVLVHAICDALLGAAGLGDIGHHFPNTDNVNENRDSREYLRLVRLSLKPLQFMVQNIDCTLVAEAPILAPYLDTMRSNLATDLSIASDMINIKATTSERLGPVGNGEGIAAYAVALLEKT